MAVFASVAYLAVSENSTGSNSTAVTPPLLSTTTTTLAGDANAQPATAASGPIARGLALGDYAGIANPSGIAQFAAATGTHPVLATEYLDKGHGWVAMQDAANIKAWTGSPYRMVIGVPILPDAGTLALGATGGYNDHFVALARSLIADEESDAILRLGWEFNGNWFTWRVTNTIDAANFAAYWRQIVTSMRSVPGEHFQFLWNPNGPSPTSYTPEDAYPGDAYVDYVGTDVYDNYWGPGPFTPAVGWAHQLSQQWGLDWLASFAAAHGKPIVIPEWSDEYRPDGHGFGDDPTFMVHMAQWFVANHVAFVDIWSYDSSPTYRNDILDGTFPNSLAQFKIEFG
jgi:hypothetical protein